MKNRQIDQAAAYAEYYQAVKDFNSTNDSYLQTIAEIANNRKLAIQRAIEIHVKPALSRVRGIQTASLVFLVISFFSLCGGCTMVNNSTNSTQASNGSSGGFGALLVLGSLGAGTIALILLMWSSSKIAALNSNIREAQEKANNPFVE